MLGREEAAAILRLAQRMGFRTDHPVSRPAPSPTRCAHAAELPTRREAAGRLARVLETTAIAGLNTNRDFLVTTLRTPQYLAGDTTTDFIERVKPPLQREVSELEHLQAAIAVAMESQAQRRLAAKV